MTSEISHQNKKHKYWCCYATISSHSPILCQLEIKKNIIHTPILRWCLLTIVFILLFCCFLLLFEWNSPSLQIHNPCRPGQYRISSKIIETWPFFIPIPFQFHIFCFLFFKFHFHLFLLVCMSIHNWKFSWMQATKSKIMYNLLILAKICLRTLGLTCFH